MVKRLMYSLFALIFFLTACGPTAVNKATTTAPASDAGTIGAPEWYSVVFTDVHNDEAFSINDFQGKVVMVETMAVWCTNCRAQQEQVVSLHQLLGARADFITIGLDIDTNEQTADLKTYVQSHGFDWRYSVVPAQVANQIGSLYGDQFLNPPSTPIVIIDRQGQAHPLPFGIKSAQDLQDYVTPYLDAGI